MSSSSDVQRSSLLAPYYVINCLMSVVFLVCKNVRPVCSRVFDTSDENVAGCSLNMNEMQILMFLGVVIAIKTKKCATLAQFLSTVFLFCKVANSAMFFFLDGKACAVYIIVCFILFFLFPEPVYRGPESIIYHTDKTLECSLNESGKVSWLIEFYTTASPACITLAPAFAQVSNSYALPSLRFGKLDVHRYPNVAEKYRIKAGMLHNHLPTLILFRGEDIVMRRPVYDSGSKKVLNVSPAPQSIINEFALNELYQERKKESSLVTKKTK
jgi:thiol-disulfide isomerase/thioredoxin